MELNCATTPMRTPHRTTASPHHEPRNAVCASKFRSRHTRNIEMNGMMIAWLYSGSRSQTSNRPSITLENGMKASVIAAASTSHAVGEKCQVAAAVEAVAGVGPRLVTLVPCAFGGARPLSLLTRL